MRLTPRSHISRRNHYLGIVTGFDVAFVELDTGGLLDRPSKKKKSLFMPTWRTIALEPFCEKDPASPWQGTSIPLSLIKNLTPFMVVKTSSLARLKGTVVSTDLLRSVKLGPIRMGLDANVLNTPQQS